MTFKTISIDDHDARVLARHWAKEYEDLDVYYAAFGCWGGVDTRTHLRAAKGIQELCDAGLLTEQECRQIMSEARARNADFWSSFQAHGRVIGFLQDAVNSEPPRPEARH